MGFYQEIVVTFVERERWPVVNGSFEEDRATMRGTETSFRGFEQFGADAGATGVRNNVDGDDVSGATLAGFKDDKADATGSRLGHDGEGVAAFDVSFVFDEGIGNARDEALLIDFPEGLEVRGSKIAQGEVHRAIVNGGVCGSVP